MRRIFKIIGKKKGRRQTGSQWWAGFSEVIFSAALVLVGVIGTVITVTIQIQAWPEITALSWWLFALQLLILVAVAAIGFYRMLAALWTVGASVERRGAMVSRVREVDLLNELRSDTEALPNVPLDHSAFNRVGSHHRFRLASTHRPTFNLLVAGLFSTLVVGLATLVAVIAIDSIREGNPNYGASGLAIILVLAAVWAFYLFMRQLLAQTGFGPTTIEVSNYPMSPGATAQLHLSQPARVRLRMIKLSLVCVEEATFREGTNIRSELRAVFDERLVRKSNVEIRPNQPLEFDTSLVIPENAMHSFSSPNNAIRWQLVVDCIARGWPDFRRVFPLVVIPSTAGSDRQ